MENANKKPQGTAFFGNLPAVPVLILIIWLAMTVVYYTIGLSHDVSLPIVLATVVWFIVWLVRAVRRA
ncbi:hypothetical protein SAMN02745146_0075 [Hymenobacter daecheongensis DSM 21074]|uniref:Uncharacterized protein n=1 Tax=Hymenobacter daecheongensis DSM 21074 TaxID=1121955 RepID=A0A1M6LVX4_9BACT|nr:hypothetical protein [Hymenobacter daecheongensis]SHJ75341.1 hypothetical protein SAMN02745146_0075 [Hymenobacter daecheongensis DSM 21074]